MAVRFDRQPHPFLWSFGGDDVWGSGIAGAAGALVHWDGVRWSPTADLTGQTVTSLPARDALTPAGIPQPPGGSYASWAPRPDLAFAIGARSIDATQLSLQDVIWRWDGQSWTEVLAGATWQRNTGTFSMDGVASMWGARPDDGWASHAAAYHWDGAAWTQVSAGPVHARCIWGVAPDDVWASHTYDGRLPQAWQPQAWHWDGCAWTLVEEPVDLVCGTGSTAFTSGGTVWARDRAWP
jgi:hypothetical protein